MERKATIFIAMPFKDELENVNYVINKYGKSKGYNVWRADKNLITVEIFRHILGKIAESDVIIADVTYSNPNVFLEIGYAWAIGKDVLLIAEKLENLPFDISGYNVFPYKDRTNAKIIEVALAQKIDAVVNEALTKSHITYQILQIAQKVAQAEDKGHIYYKLMESQINRIGNEIERWLQGSMEVNRQDLIYKGMEIFESITKGGFATFFAPIEGYWEENTEYVNKSREIARDRERNLSLERVYILSTLGSITSKQLIQSIKDDEESGIKTYILFQDNISSYAVRDFGIWDEDIVCIINTKQNISSGYDVLSGKFSKIKEDIVQYADYRREIKKHAIPSTKLIDELEQLSNETKILLQTAPRMEELSGAHCEGGYISEPSCSWYHASWQYLRLLDMVSTPSWHGDFYVNEITKCIRVDKKIRILISGTADYAMLSQVEKVRKCEDIEEVLIVDICNTPLLVCEEYNQEQLNGELNINKLRQDIKATTLAEDSYDVIVTDAFLTRFKYSDRKKIVSEWKRVLRPGGCVITTIRIESGIRDDSEAIVSNEKDINRYIQKVGNKIKKSGILIQHLEKKILNYAKVYAENIVSYPLKSEEHIKKLFEGFSLDFRLTTVNGEIKENTLYAQVVAKKCI